jgi:hypothetical protein
MQYASSTNLGFIETVLAESRPRTLQDMALFVEVARDRSFTRASKASGNAHRHAVASCRDAIRKSQFF